jgi:hypothetical protein
MRAAHVILSACLVVVSGAFLQGCTRAVPPTEVPGTYEAHYPFGKATLTLGSDGRYQQTLQIGDRTASATGDWRYLEDQNILYQHCLAATNGFGRLNANWETPFAGGCVVPVTKRFWVVGAIEIDGDEMYHYRKTSK